MIRLQISWRSALRDLLFSTTLPYVFMLVIFTFLLAGRANAEGDDFEEFSPQAPAPTTAPAEIAPPPAEENRPEFKMPSSFLIGHNMTPTTGMPRAGVWTVGTYAIGFGFGDSFFIATSPWIWVSYNTANLHLKWVRELDSENTYGFFLSYFQSYSSSPLVKEIGGSTTTTRPSNPGHGQTGPIIITTTQPFQVLDRYQWQSLSLHALYSRDWGYKTKTYFSLKYSYFWNDDFPYSIRMDPGSDDIHSQVDLTNLTFVPLNNRYYWGLEVGGLGLNYQAPYLHTGVSVAYLSPSWLVQVGASYTAQFRELGQPSVWTPGRYDTRIHLAKSDGQYYYFRYLQTALHPEIQLQYYF